MSTHAIELRPLGASDLDHIDWCLYTAVTWTPEREGIPVDAVLQHPEIDIFRTGWGDRAGDIGVVATVDGERVGVAFARLFAPDAHAAGYVDERTPELAVAVERSMRGRGIGRMLLDALAELALAHGIHALSLSVDTGNPAIRLYERAGYETVSADDDIVMLRRLDQRE